MKFGSTAHALQRTPLHQMPITLVLKSLDQKVYRDIYCLECGHPLVAISDKVVLLLDASSPMESLTSEKIIETRCRHSYCRQFYRFEV